MLTSRLVRSTPDGQLSCSSCFVLFYGNTCNKRCLLLIIVLIASCKARALRPPSNAVYNVTMEAYKQEFPIRNAGLILFHPFLETFFTRTGLMEEEELVLNKILCQLPLTSPVPLKFTPTPVEAAVCASLFEVIQERWAQMKHTTATGLREALIVRDAVIKLNGEEWNMRVAQKGYDVLLQTLPWAFSLVKAKWMDKALSTEWI